MKKDRHPKVITYVSTSLFSGYMLNSRLTTHKGYYFMFRRDFDYFPFPLLKVLYLVQDRRKYA